MSHPLLTKVLLDTFAKSPPNHADRHIAAGIIGDIPPAIADRLEAALDVCATCGMHPGWSDHETNAQVRALIRGSFHPYVPLVTR